VDDALVEAGRVQIGRLLGLQQLRKEARRRDRVAEAQARREHLRERAEVDRAVAPARRQRRRRRRVEPEVAVRVVLDQRQADRLRPACASSARRPAPMQRPLGFWNVGSR
jgi:hypothetical protein